MLSLAEGQLGNPVPADRLMRRGRIPLVVQESVGSVEVAGQGARKEGITARDRSGLIQRVCENPEGLKRNTVLESALDLELGAVEISLPRRAVLVYASPDLLIVRPS